MKWILKEAFRDRLPEEVLHKPKHGFAVPVGKWLKGELKHLLLEALDKDKIEEEGIFDYNAVKKMVDSYLAGNSYIERGIWSIFMFELWYNKWNK
jgi:asparagine synthase (glutamine-hydrolysing)